MSRIDHLLVNRAEVWRASRTPDGSGGFVETYTRVHDEMRCRAGDKREAGTALIGDMETARPRRAVYFAPSADIRRRDVLRLLGELYEVEDLGVEAQRTYLKASAVQKDRIPGVP